MERKSTKTISITISCKLNVFCGNFKTKNFSFYCAIQKKTNQNFLQHLNIPVTVMLFISSFIDAKYKV